jgi:hypothetical protein
MQNMPLGKFKDVPICDLEDSYIWWLYGRNIQDFSLEEEIRKDLAMCALNELHEKLCAI